MISESSVARSMVPFVVRLDQLVAVVAVECAR
jgi:hypothetical protein